MLQLSEADPLRLNILLDKTVGSYKDIILGLADQPGFPSDWVIQCAALFAEQTEGLGKAIETASGMCVNLFQHEGLCSQ